MSPRAFSVAAALAAFSLAGCGKDPEPAPLAPPAPSTSATNGDPPPPATVRTVAWRNPFGDTLHPDNLMLDGDFELTGPQGQMPWIAFGSMGQVALDFDTGGRCRSGVRCAKLAQGAGMLGYLASPKEKNIAIRVWVKPDSGHCGDVNLVLMDDNGQSRGTLVPQQPDADEQGWCRHELVAKSMNQYSYPWGMPELYVQAKKSAALVDDAVALPSPDGSKPLLAGPPPTGADQAQMRFVAEWVKRNRQWGVPTRSGPSY